MMETGAALRARLGVLEARGRSYLAAVGRRDALATATAVATSTSVAVPFLALCMAFVHPIPVVALLVAAIGVPLLVAAMVFAAGRRVAVDRDAALALFDREPGFKDRVTVSDEFLGRTDSGGFHAASVAEAAPWIDRALDVPLLHPGLRPAVRHALRQRAGYPIGAAAVLALAVLLGRPVAPASQRPVATDGAAAQRAARKGAAAAFRSAAPGGTLAATIAAMLGDRLGRADAAPGQADAGGHLSPSRDAVSGAERPGAGAAAGDAGGTAQAGTAAAAGGGGGDAGLGGGTGGAGEGAAGRDGGGAPGSEQASGSVPTAPAADASGGRNGARGDGAPGPGPVQRDGASPRTGRRSPQATEPGQASPNAPGSANPAAPRRSASPPPPDQAGGQRPQPGRPGERGEGQEQAQGNQPGQGSNTPGTAQEALKRSRGLSSLLLAVPTVDRLAGTPDAGASRSTLRRVSPRPRDAGAALAGDRGTPGGSAGIVARRPATPHEARLVRDYFNRGGGERQRP